jgi:NAD(P) transhydrogenase subunit alpha
MTILGFPAEFKPQEKRCAVLPVNVKAYKLLGATVRVQAGIGKHIHVNDEEYVAAGAEIVATRLDILASADIVPSLHKLSTDDLRHLKPNAIIVSYLDPFNEKGFVASLCDNNITSISMEMIPRISRCQKMDALSSQASLAGYVMVMQDRKSVV